MDTAERLKNAKAVLGKFRIAKKHEPGRPVSAFVGRKKTGRRDMTRSEYEQCGKKIRYKTESDARKYANYLAEKRGTPLRVYFCEHCQGWHMTHTPLKSAPRPV